MTEQPLVIFGAGAIGAALATQAIVNTPTRPVHVISRRGATTAGTVHREVAVFDDASLSGLAAQFEGGVGAFVIAIGTLHGDGFSPEKSFRQLDPAAMANVYEVNTILPALILKHFLPLLPRRGRSCAAAISARVGSISDNRLGGWVSYRASKAALNQVVRCAAIELARTHKDATVIGLHPGTVASPLSAPFHSRVPEGQLFSPEESAAHLWRVLSWVGPAESGRCFAWDGSEIAP